jgi:uncharacterized protein YbaR (Trm112 family)
MKLYLHNFLQDNFDGSFHYPLKIIPGEVRVSAVDFQADLIQSLVKRIDLLALAGACADLAVDFQVPENIDELDDSQAQALHHILFEVEVLSGELVSPSGRRFPIIAGIPDMCPHVSASSPEDGAEEDDETAE